MIWIGLIVMAVITLIIWVNYESPEEKLENERIESVMEECGWF